MDIWEELAEFKKRIPKDTEVYQVHVRYDNFLGEHRVYLNLTEWSDEYLGLIDAPLGYSMCGFYSTKEKAIEAITKRVSGFCHPVNWMGHLTA